MRTRYGSTVAGVAMGLAISVAGLGITASNPSDGMIKPRGWGTHREKRPLDTGLNKPSIHELANDLGPTQGQALHNMQNFPVNISMTGN